MVRECNLGGQYLKEAVWVGGVGGKGHEGAQGPFSSLDSPLDPLSSAMAYGFSFLCDCCSKLM